MACNPATATPKTRTLAAFVVPAAVESIGTYLPREFAAMRAVLYPAMEPIEERASMLWATLVRGMASLEKTVTPASASFWTSLGLPGPFRKQRRIWPFFNIPISSSVGEAAPPPTPPPRRSPSSTSLGTPIFTRGDYSDVLRPAPAEETVTNKIP